MEQRCAVRGREPGHTSQKSQPHPPLLSLTLRLCFPQFPDTETSTPRTLKELRDAVLRLPTAKHRA